jgi:thioesterase domain-containing protein
MPPSAPKPGVEELRRLGEALNARTEEVVRLMLLRTVQSGRPLEAMVEERFARVGTVSTVAVARWMAGESAEVAREVGQESWQIFAQLASQRAAPLNEVTKRAYVQRPRYLAYRRPCGARLPELDACK